MFFLSSSEWNLSAFLRLLSMPRDGSDLAETRWLLWCSILPQDAVSGPAHHYARGLDLAKLKALALGSRKEFLI